MKIMIVEDDKTIRNIISKELKTWGYEVFEVLDFENVLKDFKNEDPDLILLDIILPNNNGYYWCGTIRTISNVPIIFISSKSENIDQIMAMQMGADDYICKPFEVSLLIAKIQALLRRTYDFTNNANVIKAGDISLLTDRAILTYKNEEISFTKTELMILEDLMKSKGNFVSKNELIEKCWYSDDYIDENTLYVNMSRIRSKLKDIGLNNIIETKSGFGYKFKGTE